MSAYQTRLAQLFSPPAGTARTARFARSVLALVFCFGLGFGLSACKQKEGEICQIDDDCSSGLICNAATGKCQTPGGDIIDAAPVQDAGPIDAPIDAPPIDAAPIDAAVDAS